MATFNPPIWNFFGFQVTKKAKEQQANPQSPMLSGKPSPETLRYPSFALPDNQDGAVIIQTGAHYGTYVDLDGTTRNEVEQINKYREIAQVAEVEYAIDNIVNEAIVRDDSGKILDIRMDELEVSEGIKKKIQAEFEYIVKKLNFSALAHDIFRKWYVDGRLYYQIVIDEQRPGDGIKELRYVDPRRIRKIKEVIKTREPRTGMEIVQETREYFLYNERGLVGALTNLGTKISPDSVVYIPSGIFDSKKNNVISYLQKAIKPLNNLRMVEDALVIYRLARAPERRMFYIDVGSMQAQKAQEYVNSLMTQYRNKIVYDASTGEVRDDRRHLAMLEDYWLPRREGGRGTEISTLPGGENLGKIEDVEYFLKKMYKALGVPVSRLESSTGFQFGKVAEITRDELNFMKFVDRLRVKFATLFSETLKMQLILKRIIREDEWEDIREKIYFDFLKDNNFTELKEQELQRERFSLLQLVDPYTGKYVSVEWVRKNVLMQTEDEIEEIDTQNEIEQGDPRFQNPQLPMNNPQLNGDNLIGGPNQEQEINPEDMLSQMDQDQQKKNMRFSNPGQPYKPPKPPQLGQPSGGGLNNNGSR